MFAYTENCMKITRYTIRDKASSNKLGENVAKEIIYKKEHY